MGLGLYVTYFISLTAHASLYIIKSVKRAYILPQ